MAYEDDLNKYSAYIEERRNIEATSLEIAKRFDSSVLTLAGGAFILSLTFLEKIAPQFDSNSTWMLMVSWTALIACIVFQLLALSRSQTALNQKIIALDNNYEEYLKGGSTEVKDPDFSKYADLTRNWNTRGLWAFVIGLVFLGLFAVCNLDHTANSGTEDRMGDKKTELNESRGSYVPSALPKDPPKKPPETSASKPEPKQKPKEGEKK